MDPARVEPPIPPAIDLPPGATPPRRRSRRGGAGPIDGREPPAATVAYALHAGPYEAIGTAYAAVQGFIEERGQETAGPAREIHLVGRGQVPDPASYRTELQRPVR